MGRSGWRDRCAQLAIVLFLGLILFAGSTTAEEDSNGANVIDLKGEWKPLPNMTDPQFMPYNDETITYLFVGFGTPAIGLQLNNWISMFKRYYDMTRRWLYLLTGRDYETDMFYITQRRGILMVSERSMNKTLRAAWPHIINYPLVVQPLVLSLNVSNFTSYNFDPRTQGVHLSLETVARIYLGYVDNWNDTEILAQNPHLVGPIALRNQTIIPIAYYGRETSTYPFTAALYEHSPTYRKHYSGPLYFWPRNSTTAKLNPNIRFYENAYAPMAFARDTGGAFGYMPYKIWKDAGGSKAQYVMLFDSEGELQEPDSEAVMIPYQDAYLTKHNVLKGINYTIPGAWPISTVTYIHFVESAPQARCHKDFFVWRFIRWLFLYDEPQIDGLKNGFLPLPQRIREELVRRMEQVWCKNDTTGPILKLEIVNDHKASYFNALLGITMASWAIFTIPGVWLGVIVEIRGKKQNIVAICYTVILLIGASMCYAADIFFYLVPDENWICQIRQWVLGMGLAVMLGGLFGRISQLHRIFRMSNRKKLPSVRTGKQLRNLAIREFAICIGASLLVQMAILLAWTLKDPLQAQLTIIDDVRRTARWVCKSDSVWLWAGLEIGFYVTLLFYGLYVTVRTLDRKAQFSDSRWLVLAIYNMLLTGAAIVPIMATIKVTDANLFIMMTAGIVFVLSSTLFFTYLPKFSQEIAQKFYQWKGSSGPDGMTRSRTSSKRSNTQPSDQGSGSSHSQEPAV